MSQIKKNVGVPVKGVRFALHPEYQPEENYEKNLMCSIESKDFGGVVSFVAEMMSRLNKNQQGSGRVHESEFREVDQQAKDMSQALCHTVYQGLNSNQFDWLRKCTNEYVTKAAQNSMGVCVDLYKPLTFLICDRIVDDAVINQDVTIPCTELLNTEQSMTMYVSSLRNTYASQWGGAEPSDTNEINIYKSIIHGINQNYGVPEPRISLSEMFFPKLPENPGFIPVNADCPVQG